MTITKKNVKIIFGTNVKQKKQFKMMKKLPIILFILIISTSTLTAQTPEWLEDITNKVGLEDVSVSRIWVADIDGDNYPDLILGGPKATHNTLRVFLNRPGSGSPTDPSRVFIEFTEESGINQTRDGSDRLRISDVAALADVNNDGHIDIVTSIYYHRFTGYKGENDPGDRTEVLLNDGTGKFTLYKLSGLNTIQLDPILPQGLINASGIAFLDYDYDGNIDMYFSTWFTDYYASTADVKQLDVLFKGNGDGSFTRISDAAINSVREPMYGVNVTDWNNDGWQDIITSPYCRSTGSIFANNGNGTFRDATLEANYSAQHLLRHGPGLLCQWEANPADFDNDGDMDLLQVMVHGGYGVGEGRTTIAVNGGADKGYRFEWDVNLLKRDAPLNSHLGDMGATWFDIDNDGNLDVAIGQMSYPQANLEGQERLYILQQKADKSFEDISKKLGIFFSMKEAHSMEPIDFDLDGDQDLIVTRQARDTLLIDTVINGQAQKVQVPRAYMTLVLLENKIGNMNNWTGINPKMPSGVNQSGIGTRVTVHSGDLNQMRELQAGLGHFSNQQPFLQTIGMAHKNRIDSITVRLPEKNLLTVKVYNPPMNLNLDILPNGTYKIIKTWSEPKAIIAFKQAKLDFGTVNANENKSSEFVIQNIGDADLVVENYSISKLSPIFEFTSNPAGFKLAPGEERSIGAKFNPDKRGLFIGEVEFISNAINGTRRGYDLEGYGFADQPMIAINQNSIEFGIVHIDTPRVKELIIENFGEIALEVDYIDIIGNKDEVFELLDGQNFVIEAKSLKTIQVKFSPIEYIDYNASLKIGSNAYNQNEVSVSLSGTGDGPRPDLAVDDTYEFGTAELGSFKDMDVQLGNSGGGILTVQKIDILLNNGIFELLDFNPPYDLGANETMNVKVRFKPQIASTISKPVDITTTSFFHNVRRVSFKGTGYDPSSVEELCCSHELNIEYYPNPTVQAGFLQIHNADANYPIEIIISDESGRFISQSTHNSMETGLITLNTESLSSGVYYIQIYNGIKNETLRMVKVR